MIRAYSSYPLPFREILYMYSPLELKQYISSDVSSHIYIVSLITINRRMFPIIIESFVCSGIYVTVSDISDILKGRPDLFSTLLKSILIVLNKESANLFSACDDSLGLKHPNTPTQHNNKKVYKDWRLPTSAEIIFIINNQGISGQDADAIDYLLNGAYYYSANGPVYNSKQNQAGKAIRCVHDVYDSSLVISKKE